MCSLFLKKDKPKKKGIYRITFISAQIIKLEKKVLFIYSEKRVPSSVREHNRQTVIQSFTVS